MAGYIGTKAVNLSTTGADIAGDADIGGALDVGSGLTVDNDGSTVLTVDRATSDGAIIDLKKSGSSVGSIGVRAGDNIYIHSPHNGIEFTNTDFRPIDGNGNRTDGIVDVGDGSNRFKDLYLSGGVYLGGTGSANKLDDYEEGNWTAIDSSGASLTLSDNNPYYTKIGRLVYIYAYITYPSNASGAVSSIGGLPFGIHGDNYYPQLTVRCTSNAVSANNLTMQGTQSSTNMILHDGAGTVTNANLSGASILINGVYETTA